MTKEEIDELTRMEREASPAPWWPYSQKTHPARARAGRHTILEAPMGAEGGIDETGRNNQADRDLLFVTATRNALPRILKEREMLLKALKSMLGGHYLSDAHCEVCLRTIQAAIAEAEKP